MSLAELIGVICAILNSVFLMIFFDKQAFSCSVFFNLSLLTLSLIAYNFPRGLAELPKTRLGRHLLSEEKEPNSLPKSVYKNWYAKHSMTLFITQLTGKETPVRIGRTTTVWELVDECYVKIGYPEDQMRLLHNGSMFYNGDRENREVHKTVAELGIKDNEQVHILTRFRGD